MDQILAWDIGGANIKAALVHSPGGGEGKVNVLSRPYEIWREKNELPNVLREMYSQISISAHPQIIAVTMTAELSDVFSIKREGVVFVLQSMRESFPDAEIYALSLSGKFVPIENALIHPLQFAATNWLASAGWVAQKMPNCVLVDVGSTTTDVLPIIDGQIAVEGRSDMARLASGELVFTGVLRTNLAAVVQRVPVAGRSCRVASEYFAISGDIHLILGNLCLQDYTCSTPDGHPPSLESARRRVARLVCADTEMLSEGVIDDIARYIHRQQVAQIRDALSQVLKRLPKLRRYPLVAVGTGAFLGVDAAKDVDLMPAELPGTPSSAELAVVPCVAAAHLLAGQLAGKSQ